MNRQIPQMLKYSALIAAIALLATACSTTRRLGPNQTLYTGVSKFDINPTDGEKLPDEMVSNLKEAINVPPNNPMPFMSPYALQQLERLLQGPQGLVLPQIRKTACACVIRKGRPESESDGADPRRQRILRFHSVL